MHHENRRVEVAFRGPPADGVAIHSMSTGPIFTTGRVSCTPALDCAPGVSTDFSGAPMIEDRPV